MLSYEMILKRIEDGYFGIDLKISDLKKKIIEIMSEIENNLNGPQVY